MEISRRTCGGVRRVVVTEEQRYGPRWLRDNDDDETVVERRELVLPLEPLLDLLPSPHKAIIFRSLHMLLCYYTEFMPAVFSL